MAKLLMGKEVSARIKAELKTEVENLKKELQIMVPTEYVAQLTAEPEQFETEAETEE